MNSIDIIKQELINQKNLLDEKGFTVVTQGTHPSPTEITNTLSNIELNYDFTQATATEEDVLAGKTFYAGTSDLRTGTYDTGIIDELNNKINCLITGVGTCEITIPTGAEYSAIREYGYSSYNNDILFCKENLTIPDNILEICTRAFFKANITGKLIIPTTCRTISTGAFQYSKISEVFIGGGLSSSSSYAFSDCPNLKKIVLGESSMTTLTNYVMSYNKALEEVHISSLITSISSSCMYNCTNLKLFRFSNPTPAALSTGVFTEAKTAIMLVPYQSFHAYFTATNYQKHGNPMYGWGQFEQGETLPSSDILSQYSITWYASLDDLKAGINQITTAPADMVYSTFTAVET